MGWLLTTVISVVLMKWAEVKGYKNLYYIGLSLLVLYRHPLQSVLAVHS